MSTNQPGKPRVRWIDEAGTEAVNRDIDSTEGHRFKGAVEEADDSTEGHRFKGAVEEADDDTEGHPTRGMS